MKNLTYRPAIDGLRAIAVLSVIIFHLDRRWLPGGFIGVDVFFVISGYLITSLIYQNCNSSEFTLVSFYQRRIARIAPAFFLVALCTILCSRLFYQPEDLQQAGASLLSASLSALNISLMRGRNYFEISPDASPFMHYWSLSVEEQYYLVFPILFWFLFKHFRHRLVAILGSVTILSLTLCVYLTAKSPLYAFYLLPTRAWELCAGAMLAVLAIDGRFQWDTSRLGHWLPELGIFLLIGSFLAISEATPFPGWAAAFPVAGTVLLLLPASQSKSVVEKFLSYPSMVYCGKRSYSLYLWHWPVFAFVDYTLFKHSNVVRLPLKIGTSLFLAEGSYRLFENPLRVFFNRVSNQRWAYGFLFCLLFVAVPIGQYYKSTAYVNATPSDLGKGGLYYPQDRAKITVMLMGDSNGSMYGNALKGLCKELNYNLVVAAVGAHDTLPFVSGPQNPLWLESLESVKKYHPDCIVMANLWTDKLKDNPERLPTALQAIESYTRHIILVAQPPSLPDNSVRQTFRDGALWLRENAKTGELIDRVNFYIRDFESKRVTVIDPEKLFLDKTRYIKVCDDKGRLNFYDACHLSVNGASYVCQEMRPMLESLTNSP